MKALAIFLVIVLLAAIVGVGYLYFNSNLEISFASVAAVDPVTQQDAFSQLKSSLEAGTFIGTRYDASPLTTPDNYLWYTWTLHLENKSFLKADTIEVQITPMNGDILRYGDTAEYTLDSRMKNDLSVTMLTSRNMHSVREAIVTWYVWGLPFSTRLTLGK
jgi:hypothetical protein